MPITGSKRLEPSREKKSARQDKRREVRRPLRSAGTPSGEHVSSVHKRGR